ncbi:hypothetical protein [Pantoea sp. CCBC3-3-1]|uniref:hypothetical protein n=1 Tax=Pantoea sp. CCBC3-3-1 TaxID=2490851 RepID=UPI0011BE0881|nr:hypothetical protein [Pantoea sp. CCBC3-3-1]
MEAMNRINMFKPGIKSDHETAFRDFDEATSLDQLRPFVMPFEEVRKNIFEKELDEAYQPVLDKMNSITGNEKHIVMAHAVGCDPHTFAAMYAVWKLLFTHYGRAFIFAPGRRTMYTVMSMIDAVVANYPHISRMLTVDALSVRLTSDPQRRIEWVHPDSLTPQKLNNIVGIPTFVFVDKAHQCSNQLLETLRSKLMQHQPLLVAGEPISAQGAFKSLWDDSVFCQIRLGVNDFKGRLPVSVNALAKEHGEDSDMFRSLALAEFPQA